MSFISNSIKSASNRLIQLMVIGLICTTLLFSSAGSAFAANSQVTDSEVNLSEIQEQAEEVVNRDQPIGLGSNTVQTANGLNMVQGSADREKMKNQQNSDATSVIEQIDEGLKDLKN